jgi:hypothetical protein
MLRPPKKNEEGRTLMRYLVQFIIPALLVLAVVYLVLWRRRGGEGEEPRERSDTVWFVAILMVGAAVVLGVAWALVSLLE